MSTLSRLLLLFVGVPLLELFVLVKLGQMVGLLPTVALVVLTGIAGGILARLEGVRTLWKIRSELARGRLPGGALMDGFAILLGGALLLTPGVLTDLVGFSFLLPPTRKLVVGRIRKSLNQRLKSGAIRVTHFGGFGDPGDEAGGQTGFSAGGPPGGSAGGAMGGIPWHGQAPRDDSGSVRPGEIIIEPEESDEA